MWQPCWQSDYRYSIGGWMEGLVECGSTGITSMGLQ